MNWEAVYGRPANDFEGFFLETFRETFPASRKLLVYPQVPAEVLSEARRSYLAHWDPESGDEWLVALADPAVHGGGLHLGLAITTRGVFWRNAGQNPGAAWFEQFPAPEVRGTWLDFGAAGAIDVQHLDTSLIDSLVRFAQAIVAAWRDGVPAEFVRAWWVRLGGEQRGPYTEREMAALLRSGALLPYTSEGCGPGMADWAPMTQIDVVAGILEELKASEASAESSREAFKRIAVGKSTGPIRTRPAKPAKEEPKTVGKVIDGLIDSVLKRFQK